LSWWNPVSARGLRPETREFWQASGNAKSLAGPIWTDRTSLTDLDIILAAVAAAAAGAAFGRLPRLPRRDLHRQPARLPWGLPARGPGSSCGRCSG
jgi:hypothetical protein